MGPYSNLVRDLRDSFDSGRTRSLSFRESQLGGLIDLITKEEDALSEAMYKDLGRGKSEAYMTELGVLKADCWYVLNNLRKWLEPESVNLRLQAVHMLASGELYREPYGVTLLVGTWNFPVLLVLRPLIGAIAAGNCVLIKLSELCPHTSNLLTQLLPRYLDAECYKPIICQPSEAPAVLEEKFDMIFFTGSSRIGRLVHQAAARHLTPTVLELGGKNPVYIDETSDLDVVARRVVWSKLQNNGQVCVSADYLLIHPDRTEQLIAAIKQAYQQSYKGNSLEDESVGRLVNSASYKRLSALLKYGRVVIGGRVDEQHENIEFTVMTDVQLDSPLMNEEIFGPILPIIEISGFDETIKFINSKEKALSAHIFSKSDETITKFKQQVSSGMLIVNDLLINLSSNDLPFGGVGGSGMGSYIGKYSLECFSHTKAVYHSKQWSLVEYIFSNTRYSPVSKSSDKLTRFLMGTRLPSWCSLIPHFLLIVVVFIGFHLILNALGL